MQTSKHPYVLNITQYVRPCSNTPDSKFFCDFEKDSSGRVRFGVKVIVKVRVKVRVKARV
jgi:hypothetical protein